MKKGGAWNTRNLLLILVAFSFLIRIALLDVHAFHLDECLYIEMAEEQWDHFSIVPTYLGYDATWKPPLFFWLYSLPAKALQLVTPNLEIIYRIPNILLGVVNVLLVFTVFRKISDERTAFYTAVLFALSPLAVYTELRVLLDTMNLTFMLISLNFYFSEPNGKNIASGAAFAFLAAITKSVVALLIPLVVLAHFWKERKITPLFVISLVAVPLGLALHYASLFCFTPELANDQFIKDIFGKVYREGIDYGSSVPLSYINAFAFLHITIAFAALGILKFWKERPAATAWFALAVFPLFGSSGMMWYFYPFIPILAYFSVRALSFDFGDETEKYDHFFKSVLAILIALNMLSLYVFYGMLARGAFENERQAGYMLAGKQNVAFIGDYQPLVTAITYKILSERMAEGKYLDFGWVIIVRGETREKHGEMVRDFAANYNTAKYPVNELAIARLFWTAESFRKPTNITSFDYIVVGGTAYAISGESAEGITLEGYERIFSSRDIVIYRKHGIQNG